MNTELPHRDEHWREIVSKPLPSNVSQPLPSGAGVDVAAASCCGKARSCNTDHYLVLRLGRLQETIITSLAAADLPPRFEEYAYAMLVADGLAVESGGARASRVALSALAHLAIRLGKWNVRVDRDSWADVVEQGELLYGGVHDAVRDASRADPRLADMATSLTAAYVAGSDLFVAHVGHARAFLFRLGALTQLTTDHTLDTLRLNAQKPTLLEQLNRDQQHVVTEAIGGSYGSPDVVIERTALWSGDRLLLCTNGLTDVVSEQAITDVLTARRRPAEECQQLVDLARAAGAPDDVTVLVCDYSTRG
jgi:PPM family protein phosphatase